MARRLSRRLVTTHVAQRLLEGDTTVVRQLAAYLVSTRQTGKLAVFVRDIEAHMADQGTVIADIVSAFPLAAEVKKSITALLEKQLGADAVVFRETVDESVLGGVRIDAPGHKLDTTISTHLHTLRTRYKKA